MATTENVVRLFEVLRVWERLIEYREDTLKQGREESDPSEHYSLLLMEMRTEDWPDATFRTLISTYAKTLTDEKCVEYTQHAVQSLDKLCGLMASILSEMTQSWLRNTEQLAREAMNWVPPPQTIRLPH